jgi:hypothetical protein
MFQRRRKKEKKVQGQGVLLSQAKEGGCGRQGVQLQGFMSPLQILEHLFMFKGMEKKTHFKIVHSLRRVPQLCGMESAIMRPQFSSSGLNQRSDQGKRNTKACTALSEALNGGAVTMRQLLRHLC